MALLLGTVVGPRNTTRLSMKSFLLWLERRKLQRNMGRLQKNGMKEYLLREWGRSKYPDMDYLTILMLKDTETILDVLKLLSKAMDHTMR